MASPPRFGLFAGAMAFVLLAAGISAQEPPSSPTVPPPAQAPPEAPTSTPGTAPPSLELEPIVVTPTRTAVPISEVAESVTVIPREEIESRRATDAAELLRTVPGLNVAAGARGGPTVVQSRGGSETFNLILVDGVKINDANAFFTLGTVTTDNIERIEIVRGPLSAVYGADAMSSVIQFFTRRGRGPLQAEVSAGAGNQNTFEESAAVWGGTGPWGLSLGVGRIDADNHLGRNSGFHQTTASARLDYAPSSTLERTLALRYTDSRFDLPFATTDRFGVFDPRQSIFQDRLVVSGQASHDITPWWRHTLQLGHHGYRFELDDPLDPETDLVEVHSKTTEQRLAADYAWHVSLPAVLELAPLASAGLSYEREEAELEARFSGLPAPLRSRIRRTIDNLGGYLQTQLHWRRRLFLTAGLRVDKASTVGTELTPRASAAYLLDTTGTKFRTGYGEGFRRPDFIQTFGNGSPVVVGNPNLRPERSRSWEIGVDQGLARGRIEFSATYFDARYEDMIAFLFGTAVRFENIPDARARGVELAVHVYPTTGLVLSGTYTYLDTEIVDDGDLASTGLPRGAPLLRRPRHRGSLTIGYLGDRLQTAVTAFFVGDGEDIDTREAPPPRVRLPGYTRVDAAISYRLLANRWGMRDLLLFGRALNLFDEDYEEAFGVSAPSRTFLFGLRARF